MKVLIREEVGSYTRDCISKLADILIKGAYFLHHV